MIPNIEILMDEIEDIEYPTKTYKVEVKQDGEMDVINGYTDDLDAIHQSIHLILNTERYVYPIYSWDYGIELVDLIGQPIPYVIAEIPRRVNASSTLRGISAIPYVIAEIPRRVEEALTQDERISEVKDFEFKINKKKLHTTFVVVTQSGDINTELEVDI